ncbi:MAG: M28 family peptidase, partial [Thermoanaerobaculia bacterium]
MGSKYFAAHPTVDAKAIVADVNVDMFLPIVPLKVLKVQGIAESDLGDRAAAIAKSLDVKAIPDPEPLRNGFIRSDQYSFIRHGVPALKMDVGFEPGTPEQKVFKDWLTKRYHAPSDDLSQPVDLGARPSTRRSRAGSSSKSPTRPAGRRGNRTRSSGATRPAAPRRGSPRRRAYFRFPGRSR